MKKITFLLVAALVCSLCFISCNKDEIDDQASIQKSMTYRFNEQPYMFLQNKYIDLLLTYELRKEGKVYLSERFSYEEKLREILLLDSRKVERNVETREDLLFYENLEKDLIKEINSHPYLQKFVASFALRENYAENDMIIYTGYSDCYDAISKFEILQYYEEGIDLIAHYSRRNNLKGDEEWCFPTVDGTIDGIRPKAVRYKLHLTWGKTIEYMWNTSDSDIKTKALKAMDDWKAAANNKITFSEITKNVGWNKTCWALGLKYFSKISKISGNSSRSTLGKVPWAILDFTSGASYPRNYRHELGHTLGLYHEHQRRDRDDYVKYNSNNVESGQGSQFSKMTAGSDNYYGSTFDFNSIMLYWSTAFSKNGQPTLTKKDGSVWGVNENISTTDQNVIRQMYP